MAELPHNLNFQSYRVLKVRVLIEEERDPENWNGGIGEDSGKTGDTELLILMRCLCL